MYELSAASDSLEAAFSASYEHIDDFCIQVRRLLADTGHGGETFAVLLLLREALNNAVKHGCRGDAQRLVRCLFRLTPEEVIIQAEDGGDGFDWRRHWDAEPDELSVSGRGMRLMRRYAEDVIYNEAGNRLILKRSLAVGRNG